MRPLALTMKNFLAFADATVDFRDLRGLVLLSGENRDAAAADSNGAGKSALVDAICWALYGKTARPKSRAEDVVRKATGSDCAVTFRFHDHDKREIEIARYRKHSTHKDAVRLSVDGHDARGVSAAETQKRIDQIVGVDHDTFVGSVLYTQHPLRGRFAELPDEQKKELLEAILGVEVLSRARDVVKKDLKAKETEFVRADAATQGLRDRIAWLDAKHAELRARADDWAANQTRRAAAIEARLVDLRGRLAAVEVPEAVEAIDLAAQLRAATQAQDEARAEARRSDTAFEARISTARAKFASAKTVAERLRAQVDQYTALGDVCPVCQQKIDPGVRDAHLDELEAEMASHAQVAIDLKRSIAQLEGGRGAAARSGEAALAARAGALEELRARADALRAARVAREARLREHDLLERQMRDVEAERRAVLGERNDLEKLADDAARERDEKRSELATTDDRAAALRQEVERLSFWDRGFGPRGLKSYLLDSVLPILNERARHYADLLTGGLLSVQFSTVTEKDDGLEDRFAVNVVHRSGVHGYWPLSGGERGRVNLIINLALQDLVASRAARPLPIAIYDEAFEGLDRSGVEAAVRVLAEAARTKDLVLVITHHEHLKDLFTTELRVVREAGTSRVEPRA